MMDRSTQDDGLPQFDERGNNIADPRDSTGRKTAYMTRVHRKALERYVGCGSGLALDLGCGYGRMTREIEALGWSAVGIEPSSRILGYAARQHPEGLWCRGGLPDLPFIDAAFDIVVAQNLLRPLHLSNLLHIVRTEEIARVTRAGGRVVVVDNIWPGNPKFVTDEWIVRNFGQYGLRLALRVPVRNARWWGIWAVQLGLIGTTGFDRLSEWEIRRMRGKRVSRWRYYNVLYVFEKVG